ncbi:uncharacterized protein LOC113311711 [Papaver somniferum]|uniref:uncharacterized protein LOC113311711 n=1 Tax=Papaver somniferum TaxID=3469 RepID=UPI000E6FF2ED|nr:uncharacterized protein LOC113311711 [Papaver somniferum]
MIDCNPCDSPVTKGARVSIHDGIKLQDATEFRTIVGSLQYLTITRPDICFGVNYVSQFMHSPTDIHFQLVKRNLIYLKGTIGLGITLRRDSLKHLKAYTDLNWAGCPHTKRSTSGYAVFLGSNLISWSSKKQPTVSKSSTEAEYKCLSVDSAELKNGLTKHIEIQYHTVRELVEKAPQLSSTSDSAVSSSDNASAVT